MNGVDGMCEKCKGEGRYMTSPFPGLYSFEFCSCKPISNNNQVLDDLLRRIEEFELRGKVC